MQTKYLLTPIKRVHGRQIGHRLSSTTPEVRPFLYRPRRKMDSAPPEIELTASELGLMLQGSLVLKVVNNRSVSLRCSTTTPPQPAEGTEPRALGDDKYATIYHPCVFEANINTSTTTASENMIVQHQCPLLKLPRELRDHIHSFVYPGEVITIKQPEKHSSEEDYIFGVKEPAYKHGTGLLSTCKQIRSETIPFFFGHNIFQGSEWALWCRELSAEAVDALTEIRDDDAHVYDDDDFGRFKQLAEKIRRTKSLTIRNRHEGIRMGVAKLRLGKSGFRGDWLVGPNGEEVWSAVMPESSKREAVEDKWSMLDRLSG